MTEDYRITGSDDVTDEVLERVQGIVEGWYNEGPIDWENVWDRLEKQTLDDGRGVDMGEDLDSPAMRKIKREIRKWRAQADSKERIGRFFHHLAAHLDTNNGVFISDNMTRAEARTAQRELARLAEKYWEAADEHRASEERPDVPRKPKD